MRPAIAAALLFAALLAACGGGGTDGGPASPSPGDPMAFADATVRKDIVYCRPDGLEQRLDVITPSGTAPGPRPLAVYFHGGGWSEGSKDLASPWFLDVAKDLLSRGFAVATVDYRLAGEYPWEAQVQDARCAIRYLRAHATELGVDPARFGAWGESSGAHLAALAALADASAGFDTGEWPGVSSAVQAVVDLFGPADLQAADLPPDRERIVRRVFGRDEAALARASPMTYASASAPPFLIIHGDSDETVPISQSKALDEKLRAAGAQSELVVVTEGIHGLPGTAGTPSFAELVGRIGSFFESTLGP